MIILGIESSCDETAAAVLRQDEDGITILSNVIASSLELQAKYGGVVPDQAAREQLKAIIPVITEALSQANITKDDLDAIAVTQGPGLIGSLLMGVETAKTLSRVWQKPLIPINHLIAHFYGNWIDRISPTFPCIGLLVSGGHTDLLLFKNHGEYEYLGGTRDDAAGECFDKCARLLGLPYPGGPQISKIAVAGNPTSYDLPRPMIHSNDYDFSFSGLKTAVANLVQQIELTDQAKANLAASIQEAIVEVLVKKTLKAAQNLNIDNIMIAGGVAANTRLTESFKFEIQNLKFEIKLHIPPPNLCTDNGATTAAAAFFHQPTQNPLSIQANPNLSFSSNIET